MSTCWEQIQRDIWECDACENLARVQLTIRQQTDPPRTAVKLLVIGIAPPFQSNISGKTPAKSATSDPTDNLRQFLTKTFGHSWEFLINEGLFVLHAAKCAIQPKDRHQNPPREVVDNCAPRHLTREVLELKPQYVVTLGERARRAVLKIPHCHKPPGIKLSGDLLQGPWQMTLKDFEFTLFVSPFFSQDPANAQRILKQAAQLAEVI